MFIGIKTLIKTLTRSLAVARMAEHTAPVVKLTLTLMGKKRHPSLKHAHHEAK